MDFLAPIKAKLYVDIFLELRANDNDLKKLSQSGRVIDLEANSAKEVGWLAG